MLYALRTAVSIKISDCSASQTYRNPRNQAEFGMSGAGSGRIPPRGPFYGFSAIASNDPGGSPRICEGDDSRPRPVLGGADRTGQGHLRVPHKRRAPLFTGRAVVDRPSQV